jgi:hypothetical protein
MSKAYDNVSNLRGLPQARNVKTFGAVGDGVTDDTAAWQAALDAGGLIYAEGVFLITAKLMATKGGTRIIGPASPWANENYNGKSCTLRAGPSLSSDFLIQFSNEAAILADTFPALRSVGMENVGIDLQTHAPDCGGLCVRGAYDASAFRNINIVGVALGRIGLFVGPGLDVGPTGSGRAPTQTATFENIWSLKRAGASTTPAMQLYRLQECTMINCKAGHTSATEAACKIIYCATLSLISHSFVNASGYGLDIVAERGVCYGLDIANPLFENCLNTVRTRSNETYMFGTITSPPAIGSIVQQPADGSTATGIVYQGTSIGVYVVNQTGAFTTGTLYNASGASIGTVSSIEYRGNRAIALTNPRTIGGPTVGSAAGGDFKALINSRIDLPDDDAQAFVHAYTTNNTAFNNIFTAPRFTNMVGAGRFNEVRGVAELTFVYEGTPETAQWPFINNLFYLVAASSGGTQGVPSSVRRVTLIRPQATGGFIEVLGLGITVEPYPAATQFLIYGGGITFYRIDSTTWGIEKVWGNVIAKDIWRLSLAPFTRAYTAASFAADNNTFMGGTITNTGATGTVTANMSVYGTAVFLGTQFTVRRIASYAFRVKPDAADTILGASAAGKYMELGSDNAFATLEVVAPNTYQIIASAGTITYEP